MESVSFKTYYEIAKGLIFLFFIGCLVFAGLKAYAWFEHVQWNQNVSELARLEEARKYQEYANNIARANTEIVNSLKADIDRLRKEGSDERKKLIDDIKARDEKINNLGEIVTSLAGSAREIKVGADKTYKGKGEDDPNAYELKLLKQKFDEGDGKEKDVPVGWAMYFPNRPDKERWRVDMDPLTYHALIIQSQQKDGQYNTSLESWAFNTRTEEKIPLKIESAGFKQLKREEKEFYWWAPHINLNLDLGINASLDSNFLVGGGLSFSAMGYGRTTNDLTWRFLDFGLSSNGNTHYFKFTPFTYNIGENLPLISNTFIGPFVGKEFSGEGGWIGGIGISIPF